MAAQDRNSILATFNQSGSGTFPTNGIRGITAASLRSFVLTIVESSRNIVDDSYVCYTVTASGTNTYTATLNPAITAYASNHFYFIKFTNANSGASTLNLNGLGAKSIVKSGSVALSTGDIATGQILCLGYDGTNLQIVGGGGGSSSGSVDGGSL